MLEELIVVLLIVLIMLLSCDSARLQGISGWFWPTASKFSGEVKVFDDPLSKSMSPFIDMREEPRTWEPSTVDFRALGGDEIYKSYAEDLNANVDGSIVESHREYVADTDFLATTGASHASARDDFNPAVQFHGLPRKAMYANVGCEESSRTSQSETPEAVIDISEHNGNAYTL